MDHGGVITDSIEYTWAALVNKNATWLILILCILPFNFFEIFVDYEWIGALEIVHGEIASLTLIITLILAGVLLTLFYFGYLTRIYRGADTPPVFNAWGSLFIDGIKLMMVNFLWILPSLVCFVLALGWDYSDSDLPVIFVVRVTLLAIGLILLIFAGVFMELGNVRFARTGSIREGIHLSAIRETIRAIGWGAYFLVLVIFVALLVIFGLLTFLINLIPFVGWVICLIMYPAIQVFFARYFSRVYDHGIKPVE
jgi:hypothetical protein